MSKLFKLIFIALCFFSLGFSLSDKAESAETWGISRRRVIEVEVDKVKVETGEVFTYRIKVEGYFSSPALTLPEFNGFIIISQNQSKSYQPAKKGAKLIANFVYHLFAAKAGAFTIEPVILKDEEKKYKSKSITIKVYGRPLEEKRKILPYIEKGTNL